MMFGYGGMGGGWPVWAVALIWIGTLAFLGVLIWVGYTLMTNASRVSHEERRSDQRAHERRSGADTRGVLGERLARGEIDAVEYDRLRGLSAAGGDPAPAGSASKR